MQVGPGFADPGDLVRQAHDVGSLVMLQITTVERRLAGASEVIAPASNAAITSRPSTGSNPKKSAVHSVCIGALRESG
jgi:hypothetical protein